MTAAKSNQWPWFFSTGGILEKKDCVVGGRKKLRLLGLLRIRFSKRWSGGCE
jgi:hypothetical protein